MTLKWAKLAFTPINEAYNHKLTFKIISALLKVEFENNTNVQYGELGGIYKLDVESVINKPLEYWIQESGDHAIWFNFKAKPPNKIFIGKKADLGKAVGIIYSSETVFCPSEAKKWFSDDGELKNFIVTCQGIS